MQKMFSIHDIKANVWNTPFFSVNHTEAIRSFIAACNDPQTNLSRFPDDYELYFFGVWDEDTGKITFIDKPDLLISGLQAVSAMKNPQDLMRTPIFKKEVK
jgi:hypothetical protein